MIYTFWLLSPALLRTIFVTIQRVAEMSETGVRERGHEIVGVFALFEVLCTIACALRVYTRLRIQTAFGLDDWFAVLAWVSGRDRLGHNVTVLEAEQYRKRNSSARYFRVKTRSLRDTLPFFFIMPTYSEEDLTTAIAAYRNSEYPSIRKCAYAFNIPLTTFSKRLSTRTSRSKSHESQKILSTAEEGTLLKAITRLSKSGYPITLLLTRELAEEIRLSRFRLSSTPTSYPPISV